MPHDDSPTLSEMMAMADSPYFDDKPLTNLQRIHELEEMVSNFEEENAKLKHLLKETIGYIAHWHVESSLEDNEECPAEKLLREINKVVNKPTSEGE